MKCKAFADAFMEKYPNVKVNLNFELFGCRHGSTVLGDVLTIPSVSYYGDIFMPLNDYLIANDVDLSKVNPGALQMGFIGDKLYGVPQEINPLVLYVNVDLLEEAGLPLPLNDWTWEDFKKEYAPKLAALDNVMPMELYVDRYLIQITILEGWGGKWFDKETVKYNFSDLDVRKGFDELITAITNKYVDPGKYYLEDNPFYEDVLGSEYAFGCFDSPQSLEGINWELVPFPLTENPSIGANATFCVVNSQTENPEAAAAFALFFMTEEGQRAYHSAGAFSIPILISAKDEDYWVKDEYWDKNYQAFVYHSDINTVGELNCIVDRVTESVILARFRRMFKYYFDGKMHYWDSLILLERELNENYKPD